VVIGLDGLEPRLAEPWIEREELPALAALRRAGGYARLGTTTPAQTPVAWSTFATGVNPGAHGIFDFLGRDPETYLPQVGLNRYQQKNLFVPPRVTNLRRAEAVWQVLSRAGIPSTVLRCPCNYPPDRIQGRAISGMGVPDVRGSFGTSTFFTSSAGVAQREGETVVGVTPAGPVIHTALPGPLHPKTRKPAEHPLEIEIGADGAVIRSDGRPQELSLQPRRWSDWLKVTFRLGFLQPVRGMARFYLVSLEPFQLYASPVNYDPQSPPFPLSFPPEYAAELAGRQGDYYTSGMPEDHNGLVNRRIDEVAFLDQCDLVFREREAMLWDEWGRFDEGFLFCLFDTPDRIHHLFWRFQEPEHPANRLHGWAAFEGVIGEWYRRCDALVNRLLSQLDERTLLLVVSDHGCASFRRCVDLNRWLYEEGLLALRDGRRPGKEALDMLRGVDWPRTAAYAVGLSGIYLNLEGREGQGCVAGNEADELKRRIATRLAGLRDPQNGQTAVRRVCPREQVYHGPYTAEAPDLLVHCAAGYRASWSTVLGGIAEGLFEDNTRCWSGDHVVDPELTPGVLLASRPFFSGHPRLIDLAPTILSALGVPCPAAMEGEALLR
jgi:predicted AlkP superfamily phosphohydrolase/phosphomutase